MEAGQLPVLVVLLYLLSAPVTLLAGLWHRELAHRIAVAAAGAAAAAALAGLLAVLEGGELRYHLGGWPPPLGIEYVLDPLSAFLSILVAGIGLLVVIYSGPLARHELRGRRGLLYPLMLLLLAGLAGMVATGDLFNLYVFLEIASLAAYALIATGDDRRAPLAAFRYLILGSLAGGFYLLGVGFLYFATGSLNMADVATLLPPLHDSRAVLAAAALMVLGLGLKMALFPLHGWLPDAYTHAPYSVSSLIAPIMTKVSVYAIVRLLLDVFGPGYLRDVLPVVAVLGWLGAAGIVAGSVLAIAQPDYRRMLAYSSVAQLGFVAVGIGMGSALGLVGALLHVLNHAFMKGCLFLVGGGVRLRTGAVTVAGLAGLGRRLPWTMACFTVAALSMVGIPPTAGFFSKWYLALASVEAGHWVFLVVIVSSSLLTAVYIFRLLENVYERREAPPAGAAVAGGADVAAVSSPAADEIRDGIRDGRELPPAMLGPIAILAGGVLVLGLANAVIVRELLAPLAAPLGGG